MGVWIITADVLARSRFAVSPLLETGAVMGQLATGRPHPCQSDQHRRLRPAFRDRVQQDLFTVALFGRVLNNSWMPDFMGRPPRPAEGTFDDEIARLRSTPPAVALHDLEVACRPGPLPEEIRVADPAGAVADVLTWVWQQAVEPEWDRRRRLLQADVVARTSAVSRHGLAAALNDLSPKTRWLGDGRLQINQQERAARELRGAELVLIPTSATTSWVVWDLPASYGIVYPAKGLLDAAVAPSAPALANLLGRSRAQLLAALDQPSSTTHLVARTSLSLGTVSHHLHVLHRAGLAHRRRSGASVLYYRSILGDQLVAESATPR